VKRAARYCLAAAIGFAAAIVAGAAPAKGPFGVTTPEGGGSGFGGPLGPFFVWIALYQAQFYKALTDALTTLKENPWGVWLLLALSFAYGVFHAVGPGHGKAVITSYLVSSGETVRHGVLLSFAAAMVQAAVAIILVVGGAILLRFTAMQITDATDWLEAGSYAAIAIIGAWLLWTKSFGGGHHHHHHHVAAVDDGQDHAGHDHDDHDHDHHDHDDDNAHHHHHDHQDHAPAPARSGVTRAWAAIVAVGVRPCSGAIIVLVFALSQGLFAAGIAAAIVMGLGTGLTVAALAALAVSARSVAVRLAGAESPTGVRLVRVLEIVGAACVMLFGLVLLGGAIAGGLPI
jgi:nickel/cobalt exporter